MYCKIELIPKKHLDEDKAEEMIWDFLVCLKRNGQILKEYSVAKDHNYCLYVTFPKNDSFDEKYDGIYVKERREKINEHFDIKITSLGENIQCLTYCTCSERSAIEMQTYNHDINSVFTCFDCGNPIALYELPFVEEQDDHYYVEGWQKNYSSMDTLWMTCLCDRYTGNQLRNPDSALNRQGIELAQSMSARLGYPIYYHLECMFGNKIKTKQVGKAFVHVCPKCNQVMKRAKIGDDRIDICNDCKLSYDAHNHDAHNYEKNKS